MDDLLFAVRECNDFEPFPPPNLWTGCIQAFSPGTLPVSPVNSILGWLLSFKSI